MVIAFDAKRAFRNFTGLGNYSRFIIDILMRRSPENRYIAYSPSLPSNRAVTFMKEHPDLETIYPTGLWSHFKSLWRTFGISRQLDGVDIYHGLSNELPWNSRKHAGNTKTIVTMHDVIYRRLPHCYLPIDRWLYDLKYGRSCRLADHIIAVSECTKRDVITYYDIPADKIDVVYQGCDPSFRQPVPQQQMEQVRLRYGLPEKFILNVGTIEERKNALLSIKALENISSDVHLVLVGGRTKYVDTLEKYAVAHGLSQRIHYIHHVFFADLPAIYHLSSIFVYPSRYEGFGIPILEALCCSTPVIAATGSCLEEAGGPGSIYVSPDDHLSLAQEVNRLLSDEHARNTMISQGLEWAANFTDDRLADSLLSTYTKLRSSTA